MFRGRNPITILIAEVDAGLRQRLARCLVEQAGIQVVGEAKDGHETLGGTEALHPDILLLDIQLTQIGGLREVAHIRAMSPATKILILADFLEEAGIVAVWQHGAHGYLLKTGWPAVLVKAIRTTHSGDLRAPRKLLTRLLEHLHQRLDKLQSPVWAMRGPLTQREQEILSWTVQGMTNKEIAARLGISAKTVKTHLQNVFRKLQVHRRGQLLPHNLPAVLAPSPSPPRPYGRDTRT